MSVNRETNKPHLFRNLGHCGTLRRDTRVFHSLPIGISRERSNCALLVYGYGKSFVKYFAAFFVAFFRYDYSGLCQNPARDCEFMPAIFFIACGLGVVLRIPCHCPSTLLRFLLKKRKREPKHRKFTQPGNEVSTSCGASASISRRLASSNS